MSRAARVLVLVLALALMLVPALAGAAKAPPPLYWQRLSPLTPSAHLRGAAYGGGVYAAVGDYGTLLTSADGSTWTEFDTRTDRYLTAITYGGGQFMALAEDGAGLISTDGKIWTLFPTGIKVRPADMVYGGNRFVAVGAGGWIGISTNGKTWRHVESGTMADLRGVAYGNGLFVAVGGFGQLLTSTNGEKWTRVATGVQSELHDIAYGGGRFLAVGTPGTTLMSTDGAKWEVRSAITAKIPVFYDGGRVVAENTEEALAAPIGSWTLGFEERPCSFYRVSYGPGGFVVTDNVKYFTSADGVTWTPHYPRGGNVSWPFLTAGPDRYVSVGWFGESATSADGITWKARSTYDTAWVERASYVGDRYLAVGRAGTQGLILSSKDAKQWSVQRIEGVSDLRAVTYAMDRYVAVGRGVATSADGIKWDVPISGGGDPDRHYDGVAYGNNRLVALGTAGHVLVSLDGKNWARYGHPKMGIMQGLAFGNGLFVAYGPGSELLVSSDGIEWTSRPLPGSYNIEDLIFGEGRFVVAVWSPDESKNLLLSTEDAVSFEIARPWTEQVSKVNSLAYGDGQFVAAGSMYDIAVSDDGKEWRLANYRGEQLWSVARGGGRIVGVSPHGAVWVTVDGPQADLLFSEVRSGRSMGANQTPITVVTVVVRDRDGLPIAGRHVVLEPVKGTPPAEIPPAVTDARGMAVFRMTTPTKELVTYRVRLVEDDLLLATAVTTRYAP